MGWGAWGTNTPLQVEEVRRGASSCERGCSLLATSFPSSSTIAPSHHTTKLQAQKPSHISPHPPRAPPGASVRLRSRQMASPGRLGRATVSLRSDRQGLAFWGSSSRWMPARRVCVCGVSLVNAWPWGALAGAVCLCAVGEQRGSVPATVPFHAYCPKR